MDYDTYMELRRLIEKSNDLFRRSAKVMDEMNVQSSHIKGIVKQSALLCRLSDRLIKEADLVRRLNAHDANSR